MKLPSKILFKGEIMEIKSDKNLLPNTNE